MAAGRPPSVPNRGSYHFQPGTWHSVVLLALSNNKTLKNCSRVRSEMHVRTFLKTCSCDLLGIAKGIPYDSFPSVLMAGEIIVPQ